MSVIKRFLVSSLILTLIFIIKKTNATSSNITLEYSDKGEATIFQDLEGQIYKTEY